MSTKPIKLEISDADKLHALTRIMQGLLASGDYVDNSDPLNPEIRVYDFGKDWKEDGLICRFVPNVITDAEALLTNAIMTLKEDSEP